MGDFSEGLGGGLVNTWGSPGEMFGNNVGNPGEVLTKKRGRPVKDGSKRCRQQIRMTDEQSDMLDYICDMTGKTKTEVLLEGLRMQHNMVKFR